MSEDNIEEQNNEEINTEEDDKKVKLQKEMIKKTYSNNKVHNSKNKKTSLKTNDLNKDINKLDITSNEDKSVLITEVYLKKKFDNLEIPKKIKNVVSQGLNKTNENIYNDMSEGNININSKSENITSLLNNPSLKRRLSRETIKKLKNLKQNGDQIKSSIHKLDTSKKIIEGESNLNGNIIEENIRKSKIKEIDEKINDLNKRLYDINLQIDKITDLIKPTKKEIMDNFNNNFEKERENYIEKAKKFFKDSLESKKKFMEDKKITSERREKYLIEKEKEDLERKEKLLIEKNQKEKQNILKRKKEIDQILEKTKQYINEKNNKTEKDYLFYINKEKYENEKMKFLEKSLMTKKKETITIEEIQEFDSKLKKQKKILENGEKEKSKILKEMWNDRNQIVKSFKTNISENMEKEEKKIREQEQEKKAKIKELETLKINYSNKSVPKPIINPKLKKSREERKDKIDKESVLNTETHNKKRMEMYQLPPPINKKNDDLHINTENVISISKSGDFNNYLFSKPKKLKPIRLLHPKPERPINYLEELKGKKSSGSQTYGNQINIDINENDNNKVILEKLKIVEEKSNDIDNQIKLKKEEMKLKGGYSKNTKIGDEIGKMIIKSIEDKINIMNKLK